MAKGNTKVAQPVSELHRGHICTFHLDPKHFNSIEIYLDTPPEMAEATSSNASASTPVILSQIVSLLAHGLTISNDDEVWLDGLRMLAEPKLHRSLSMTSPIWMPLLQRSLTPTRSPEVIIAGLKLLARVADLIEAMRPAFVKPFKALVELDDDKVMGAPELYLAVEGLGLEVMGKDGRPLGQGAIVSVHLSIVRCDRDGHDARVSTSREVYGLDTRRYCIDMIGPTATTGHS